MKKEKVAIIGAGVVGASAAYFLSLEPTINLTVYDEGAGQGTSAAAGIISPWLSKRRNKEWYRMVKEGAAFYPDFLKQVMADQPIPSSVYKKVGTLLFKKKEKQLADLLEIGKKRREEAPEIGELAILTPEEIRSKIPIYTKDEHALWAEGGARVDGEKLVQLLRDKATENGANFVSERVSIRQQEGGYVVTSSKGETFFDTVILAVAAWLPELLEPLQYTVDIRPQKGQLIEVKLDDYETEDWPVIMPEGEKDIIPFTGGHIIIGATHENEAGFDLSIDQTLLQEMVSEASEAFSSHLTDAKEVAHRSGTRAYTSDFAPFFGLVPESKHLYTASGLGSTGLTAGPLVGKCLAQLVLKQEPALPLKDYPIARYVKKN